MIWSNLVAGSLSSAISRGRRHPVLAATHVDDQDLVAKPVHLAKGRVQT